MTKTMQRILRKEKTEPQSKASSLEEELKSQTRLLDTDKKILAENLGRICEELNPDKPLAAAMALIEKAQPNLRQKRKRYIRLPGEEPSPDGEKFAYGSTGATFAKLAKTAAEMRSTSNDENVKQRDKENNFKKLLRGTSFLPANKPLTLAGRRIKDILDEYEERLIERIEKETRLTELWEILQRTPMRYSRNVDLPARIGPPQYGSAQLLPDKLTKALCGKDIEWARFYVGSRGFPFYGRPILEIGDISTEITVKKLEFPKEVRKLFLELEGEGESKHFGEKARKWLDFVDYNQSSHWVDEKKFQINNVFLEVVRKHNGKPKLIIELRPSGIFRDYSAELMDDEKVTEILSHDGYNLDYLLTKFEFVNEPYVPLGLIIPPNENPFPLCEDDAPIYGWTEDDVISEILMGDGASFRPCIDDYLWSGPFHSDSVGAALIGNLKDSEEENRIDKILIEQARLMAEAGIAYYEKLFDESREALLKISED
jgi:hypothetical protein